MPDFDKWTKPVKMTTVAHCLGHRCRTVAAVAVLQPNLLARRLGGSPINPGCRQEVDQLQNEQYRDKMKKKAPRRVRDAGSQCYRGTPEAGEQKHMKCVFLCRCCLRSSTNQNL